MDEETDPESRGQFISYARIAMATLKDRRVLLIGGGGFIGHNLALHLQELGAEVSIIDSLQVNNFLALLTHNSPLQNKNFYLQIVDQRLKLLRESRIPMYAIDARDYHALSRAFDEIKPQVVVQLAAVAHADRSNKDPYSTFDHSLRTLENALDASRGMVEHFVFFSSSMVYGNFKDGFVTEDSVCEPLGIYGALKFAGEKMVIAYNQVFDLPYTIVRPSALYGPRCISRRVGQILIENAIRGVEVTISGDGSDRLDFTYIGDLVQGVTRIIESEKSRGEVFNITYGGSRSISEMVDILKSHFPDLAIKSLPRDKLMPSRGTLSVEKAKTLIDYDPQFPLETGFPEYIAWYKDLFSSVLS